MVRRFTRYLILASALTISLGAVADWKDCRKIDDDGQRLACFDAYALELEKSGGKPVVSTEQARADFGMPVKVETAGIDEIVSNVARVSTYDYGKRILTLENGQIWYQVDRHAQPKIRPGDEVKITRAILGSFLLKATKGGRALRVRRKK